MVKDFLRIVHELDASYFVFENVKGLTVGRHRQFLDELISAFEGIGYCVRQEWKVLNAVSYGVPQDRERLILIGAKLQKKLPRYPEAAYVAAGARDEKLPCGPSCKDALGDLPEVEKYQLLFDADEIGITVTVHLINAPPARRDDPLSLTSLALSFPTIRTT